MNDGSSDRPLHRLALDAAYYEIRVKGHLDGDWADWFDEMTILNLEGGEAVLAGMVADQSALYGLISRLRDLNLTLVAVTRYEGS